MRPRQDEVGTPRSPAGAELCPGHPALPGLVDAGAEKINALSPSSPPSPPAAETFLAPTALNFTGHFPGCLSREFGTSEVGGLMGLEANPPHVPRPSRAAGSSRARPWMLHVGEGLGTEAAELWRGWRGAAASASSSFPGHRAAGRDLQGGGRAKVMSTCLLGGTGCQGALPIPEHPAHSGMGPGADPGCGGAWGRADPASAWEPKVAQWHPAALSRPSPPRRAKLRGSWHCVGP